MADFIPISQINTYHELTYVKALAVGIAKAIYRDIFILSLSFPCNNRYNSVEVSTAI